MTLFLASTIPAAAVALIGWGVAVWARSTAGKAVAHAKAAVGPLENRYGGWDD